MTTTSDPEPVMQVETCERCGRRYPCTDDTAWRRHHFCEPCREALWRSERSTT